MATVTSTEFQKNVGLYNDMAQREPVIITKQKRESLVVLSFDEYSRLKMMDTRRAFLVSEMPDDLIDALEKAEPPEWTAMYDAEMDS
jgi:PHD/YefM family antitoxin component YafN of YafNO toxin-antitoxin module